MMFTYKNYTLTKIINSISSYLANTPSVIHNYITFLQTIAYLVDKITTKRLIINLQTMLKYVQNVFQSNPQTINNFSFHVFIVRRKLKNFNNPLKLKTKRLFAASNAHKKIT